MRGEPTMKQEERSKLIANIPEKYKKAFIFGLFGGGIGGGVGGYFSAIKGNDLYSGIGGGLGFLAGWVFGFLIHTKVSFEKLISFEKKVDLIVGLLSILMAIAGITVFFSTGDWNGLIGAILFGFGGLYFIFKPFKHNEKLINGLLSILIALAGLYLFIQTGSWIGIIGVIFFGLGGIFLIYTGRSR